MSIELLNNNEMSFAINGSICIDIYSTIYPYIYLYSFEVPSKDYIQCKGTIFDKNKNLLLLSIKYSSNNVNATYCFNTLTRQTQTIITDINFDLGHVAWLTKNRILFQNLFVLVELNLDLFTMKIENGDLIINDSIELYLLSNNEILLINYHGKIHKIILKEHKVNNLIKNYLEVKDYYKIIENTKERKIIIFSFNKIYIYSK